MPLPIKPARREFYLVMADMIGALGGYKSVASLCMVTPVSASKWKEDPFRSGQNITVVHLQTLLARAGEALTNLPLQNATDELIQDHFLNLCHRRALLNDQIFAVVEMLQGQTKRTMNE